MGRRARDLRGRQRRPEKLNLTYAQLLSAVPQRDQRWRIRRT
jgi:hypothetical protein